MATNQRHHVGGRTKLTGLQYLATFMLLLAFARIQRHTHSIECCHFLWSSVTPKLGFKDTVVFEVNVSKTVHFRDKVTIGH